VRSELSKKGIVQDATSEKRLYINHTFAEFSKISMVWFGSNLNINLFFWSGNLKAKVEKARPRMVHFDVSLSS
jgi:hypothetical protein